MRFVFPHAPTRPVTINGGYVMRAWYDILGLDARERREDEPGCAQSQALVEALIAREKARGIAAARIVLAGFSQGCAMTLMTGLRHAERLAGLVGLSGYLPLAGKAEAERHDANRDVPIFLAHGTHGPGDPDRPRAAPSRDALVRARPRRSSGTSTRCRTRSAPRRSPTSNAGCCACWPEPAAPLSAPFLRRRRRRSAGRTGGAGLSARS